MLNEHCLFIYFIIGWKTLLFSSQKNAYLEQTTAWSETSRKDDMFFFRHSIIFACNVRGLSLAYWKHAYIYSDSSWFYTSGQFLNLCWTLAVCLFFSITSKLRDFAYDPFPHLNYSFVVLCVCVSICYGFIDFHIINYE